MKWLWTDLVLLILLIGVGAWNIIQIPQMLSSHPCYAMFNMIAVVLDASVAGLIGMDFAMEVKRARRRASTRRF